MNDDAPLKPAIFLDRDNTLIHDFGFMYDPKDIQFLDDVFDALRMMKGKGYLLILITNQSGIERGYYTEAQMHIFHEEFQRQLRTHGAELDAIYFCPHAPETNCECRKPKIALVEQAIRELKVNRSRSYFVGDRASDILCGRSAGLKTFLITQKPGGTLLNFAQSL